MKRKTLLLRWAQPKHRGRCPGAFLQRPNLGAARWATGLGRALPRRVLAGRRAGRVAPTSGCGDRAGSGLAPPTGPNGHTPPRAPEGAAAGEANCRPLLFGRQETDDPRSTRGRALLGDPGPCPPLIPTDHPRPRDPGYGILRAAVGRWMAALVEHVEFGPIAIHRTWLQTDGAAKAAFRDPRRSLGPVGGGRLICLAAAREDVPLIIGEGIETAASAMLFFFLHGCLERWRNGAALTTSAADRHEGRYRCGSRRNGVGIRAARTAAERWTAEGRQVRIMLPPAPGQRFQRHAF